MDKLEEVEKDLRNAGYSYIVSKEIDGNLQAKITIIVRKTIIEVGIIPFDKLPGYH